MLAFALMLLLLLAPVSMWYAGDPSWLLVAAYVVFTIPAIIEVTVDAIRTRTWPSIVSGPGIQFGRHRYPKR